MCPFPLLDVNILAPRPDPQRKPPTSLLGAATAQRSTTPASVVRLTAAVSVRRIQ